MGTFVVYVVVTGVVAAYLCTVVGLGGDPVLFAPAAAVGVAGAVAGGVAGYVLFGEDFADIGLARAAYLGALAGASLGVVAYAVAGRHRHRRRPT